ncbi:proteasome assembly chaperone 3 [Latimeria chalumnae]|uniref:Proteasome assembly chaperone 3 n=1 Tax=Latimeria chalumnae TaxID=7897 RepID=H3AN86_LATCH|nr:PREDICTED: proteasome assembly chaperone 3 [Latimeria chalumnae]|eukprot:XP_005999027.1 PREDICTED: proteasome assembly chaperone 3 [Latimeria chalumnae]
MAMKPILESKQKIEEINGVRTEVVCTAFSDHIFVVVTQFGKMGTLILVTPSTIPSDINKPTFTTKVLLGKDEPLAHVCAKNLVTSVSEASGNRPVLLALALKDTNIEGLKSMKGMIHSCQVW